MAFGFLVRNWVSGGSVTALQLREVSSDLHASLAASLRVSSYRAVPTLSVDGGRKGPAVAARLDKEAKGKAVDSATAQVVPMELKQKVVDAAVERGAD